MLSPFLYLIMEWSGVFHILCFSIPPSLSSTSVWYNVMGSYSGGQGRAGPLATVITTDWQGKVQVLTWKYLFWHLGMYQSQLNIYHLEMESFQNNKLVYHKSEVTSRVAKFIYFSTGTSSKYWKSVKGRKSLTTFQEFAQNQ